jgi:hypothetical protein
VTVNTYILFLFKSGSTILKQSITKHIIFHYFSQYSYKIFLLLDVKSPVFHYKGKCSARLRWVKLTGFEAENPKKNRRLLKGPVISGIFSFPHRDGSGKDSPWDGIDL